MSGARERVVIERPEEGVVVVHMRDRAGRNALSKAFLDLLEDCLASVGTDERDRVCVLRGLPEVFCSGGTREDLLRLAAGEASSSDIGVVEKLLDVPLPTLALMEGHAVGGGLPLGLAADIVMMATESRYGATFMNLGFTPGMGTTRLLPEAVGEHLAAEMMFGGQTFRGTRFANCPGINYVLPREDLVRRAFDLAIRIAEKPRGSLVMLKRALVARRRRALESAREIETEMHGRCFAEPGAAARIEAAFLDS